MLAHLRLLKIFLFCCIASVKNVSAKRTCVSLMIYVLFLATAAINS